nr:biotin/lipoyl-binding protein [Paracoccaceae bacterium]
MTDVTVHDPAAEWYAGVPRSIRGHAILGLTLMALAFGGFGLWSFTAPLAAAVIAQGSFVATGRNQIVQHLEGGIIETLFVSEGDVVAAGDGLLSLDQTSAEATERELFL